MSKAQKQGNILMIIALFIFMGMQPTLISKSISVFQPPIEAVHGISKATFMGFVSISGIFAAFLAPVTAQMMKKLGVKVLMLVSAILSCASFWALTLANGENAGWLIPVLGVVCGLSQLGISNVVISTIVTSWYPGQNSGTMIGIVMAGSNLFNFMWLNVIGSSLAKNGNESYASLMTVLTLIMAAVSIALILFVFRVNPAMNTAEAPKAADGEAAAPVEVPGMTMKEAQKTPVFWLFALALFGLGIVVTGVQSNAIIFFTELSDAAQGASIWSVAAPCAVISNFGLGILFSKIGAGKTIGILAVLQAATCILLALTTGANVGAFGLGGAALYGLSAGVATTAPAYLTNLLFGQKAYAQIYGMIMLIFFLGCTVGSVITAIVAQAAGYVTMWWIDLGLVAVAYFVFFLALGKGKKEA